MLRRALSVGRRSDFRGRLNLWAFSSSYTRDKIFNRDLERVGDPKQTLQRYPLSRFEALPMRYVVAVQNDHVSEAPAALDSHLPQPGAKFN